MEKLLMNRPKCSVFYTKLIIVKEFYLYLSYMC